MEMKELARYYLLAISFIGYKFNKTSSKVNKGIQVIFHKFYNMKFISFIILFII